MECLFCLESRQPRPMEEELVISFLFIKVISISVGNRRRYCDEKDPKYRLEIQAQDEAISRQLARVHAPGDGYTVQT